MEMGRQEGWGSSQRSLQKGFTPLPPHVSQSDTLFQHPRPGPPLGPMCQQKKREYELGWGGLEGPCNPWPHNPASPQGC